MGVVKIVFNFVSLVCSLAVLSCVRLQSGLSTFMPKSKPPRLDQGKCKADQIAVALLLVFGKLWTWGLDGRSRAIVIAESLARVIAAIRIASVRWRSHLPPNHRN